MPVTDIRRHSQTSASKRHRLDSVHWLFRTNIPRRKASFLPADIQKRNFFGMGDVIGVLANPAETVRSLSESKRLLEEARREINENRERAQIRTKHTFSRLPGFFARRAEIAAVERALEGDPSFTVLFGGSSTGKTALLREVLCSDKYHVLHFDLRIAGFADISSLYMSLSQQMEQYFEIASNIGGYDEFKKEAWSFKHDRLNVERRMSETSDASGMRKVKPSDIARLMELFQSSLLKYWEFQPPSDSDSATTSKSEDSSETKAARSPKKWWLFSKKPEEQEQHAPSKEKPRDTPSETPAKKMPVIFFDEAHKLPALIQSTATMKCLLDSMLVLTKQDRLCHVIHATSDPFYQTWLRQLNVMQHCKVITIGDCSRSEARSFFRERLLPRVPQRLHSGLDFQTLYDAFGGKLAHWQDYVADYVHSNGNVDVKHSSHFMQAHALLNLHIIHSSQEEPLPESNQANYPNTGFRVYSAISRPSPMADDAEQQSEHSSADFTADQLLKVMDRFVQDEARQISYFLLCREFGVRAVDGMVKGKILDLRWTEPVSREILADGGDSPRLAPSVGLDPNGTGHFGATSSGTMVDPVHYSEDEEMEAVSERELHSTKISADGTGFMGPLLVPATPIMRLAMQEVLEEYRDDASVSEYASLSDIDEY